MNIATIRQQISSHFHLKETSSQQEAILKLAQFILDEDPYSIFLLKGFAGTGKTTLLKALADTLQEMKIPIKLLASTGRAARTLSLATQRKALTIHREIYAASIGGYQLKSYQGEYTIFIVDEASMIGDYREGAAIFGSGDLLEDLMSYVYGASSGCKIIFVGDTAQLPPVGLELSPALSKETLEERYGLTVYEAILSDVVRQEQNSGILYNATLLREILDEMTELPGEQLPILLQTEYPDIELIESSEILDSIDMAYRRFGQSNTIVIAPSNRRALEFNMGIRSEIFYYEDNLLLEGEPLIVSRNNYHYTKRRDRSDFIANGEIVEISRIYGYQERYGYQYADVKLYLPDRDEELEAKILLSMLQSEMPQMSMTDRKALYELIEEDYAHITSLTERNLAIRKDPFWGAIEVKYAYAITAHRAQGGQWHSVFVDLGLVRYFGINAPLLRWLYTSITRAEKQLYLMHTPTELIEGIEIED